MLQRRRGTMGNWGTHGDGMKIYRDEDAGQPIDFFIVWLPNAHITVDYGFHITDLKMIIN
jgi:hypothetical protein